VTSLGLHLILRGLSIVFTHFLLQIFYAHRSHRRSLRSGRSEHRRPAFTPSVDVVVPAYNETPERLEACFDSLLAQDYEGETSVYVVDDGSPNRAEVAELYARYAALPGWRVYLPENGGKRHAQSLAFADCASELVVTIDSDTEIASDGIRTIVSCFRNRRVGAVTGNVGASNHGTNLLTRLIGMRYWIAFNQERAAQGFFRSVLCCSGPFAVYRRSVLARVWDQYVTQTFRGIACTYGDDRHLTNLVLAEGYDVTYEPRAHAVTGVPTGLREYLRQQLRWNKSFYRELLWTFQFLPNRPWYLTFEILVQVILPLLLMTAVASALVFSLLIDPAYLLHYALTVTVMAVVRCSYAMIRNRDPRYLIFVLYGFLHAALLVPIRVRALATLTDNSWGTRA
jgi:hyaluronan synthase